MPGDTRQLELEAEILQALEGGPGPGGSENRGAVAEPSLLVTARECLEGAWSTELTESAHALPSHGVPVGSVLPVLEVDRG